MTEPSKVLTVHWKDHSQQLSEGLWNLFKKELLVDTNVSLHGDTIKVHSLLLTVFIPFFTKMSSDNTVKEINLDYVAKQKEDVQNLVEFVYTGKTTITEDRIDHVRSLARDLEFKSFESSIEESELTTGVKSGVEDHSPITENVVKDDPSTSLEKNVETSSGDTGSTKCGVTLRPKVVSSKRKTTTPKKKPIRRASVQATKEKSTNSDVAVTITTRTRSRCAALKRTDKPTDGESKKPIEESEDAATEASEEEEDSDENITREDRKRLRRREYMRNYRNTATVTMKCGDCEYETMSKSEFKRHMKQHKPTELKCDKCNKEFRCKRTFGHHKNTSCGQDLKFVCDYCGHRTLRQKTLTEHLAAKHRVDLSGNPLEKNVKCTKCDFICWSRHQLAHHGLRKHNGKRFECPHCEYAAVVRSELRKHISIRHLKERKFICHECGVSYQTSGALNVHIRIKHKGMKLFKCDECDKEFACRNSYKIHMSKHAGTEKLFVCHICGYSCNRRSNLGTHMKKQHGITMESTKKVYAPRQNIKNEVECVADNLATQEATVAATELHNVDYILAKLQ